MVPGVLIAIATIAGMYAVAATTANGVAATFNPTETTNRTRNVDFATGVKRVLADHKAARAQCALLAAKPKRACESEARAKEKRAFKTAFQP